MAPYAVTDYTTVPCAGLEALAAAMEVLQQSIDATKAIYYIDIVKLHDEDMYKGVIIAAA